MKRALLLLVVLAAAACRTELLPDGGVTGPDGGVIMFNADLSQSCDELRTEVSALLVKKQPCVTDGDCVAIGTSCGLAGVCGAFVTVATGDQVRELVTIYDDEKCGANQACPGCGVPPMAACIHGLCGPPSN